MKCKDLVQPIYRLLSHLNVAMSEKYIIATKVTNHCIIGT